MSFRSDRWMLPDGIEEMLPPQAARIQRLRRELLDTFRVWGYDYVIPPMVEFVDSLLTGTGREIDLRTCKVTDQLTGKLMGIRADITPQVARIDAHSMKREGVNRLCYSGHVMHAKPRGPLASRIPIQAGVEIFGESSVEADIEVLSLLADVLSASGLRDLHINLAEVSVFRELARAAGLSSVQEAECRELIRNRRVTELAEWLPANVDKESHQAAFNLLPELLGGEEVLDMFCGQLAGIIDCEAVAADLRACYRALKQRFPDISVSIDLSELRGYSYHTGIVFAAYTPSSGHSLAAGGRYDHVGESFGRARPATGFVTNVSAVASVLAGYADDEGQAEECIADGVFVPASSSQSPRAFERAQALRKKGERVVFGFSGQENPQPYQACSRKLDS